MNNKSRKNSQFDVTEILTIIWRRKWYIIIPLIVVSAVTFGGSYLITPMYESSIIIWVGNQFQLSSEIQHLIGNMGRRYVSEYDRRMELRSLQNEITSAPYISQLIENLDLDQDPTLDEKARAVQASSPNLSIDQVKFDILLRELRDNISISYVGEDQVQITAQSASPGQARDIAKTLGDVYISEKQRQELGTARQSQDFTYEQLSKYEKDLNDKIAEKTEFEKEFNKIQLDEAVTSDENRRDIQSEINNTRLEIEDKKQEERDLLAGLSGTVGNSPKLSESDALKNTKNQIRNHLGSIANLMQKYNWTAREILNHKARLINLLNNVEAENKRLVDNQYGQYDDSTRDKLVDLFNVQDELEILYARVNSLQLALADLNGKIDMIPEYQARLDQLDREVVSARDLRDKFRDQQESSQIRQALLRESKYKVIEPAKVPLAPYKPKRTQIIVLGVLLGLAIGGSAALLTEMFDKSFRKVDDVEDALGFPVIGVIPKIETVQKLKIKK